MFPVAPGLYSADTTGQGLAAAGILRVKAGGSQIYSQVDTYNATTAQYVAEPIDLSTPADQVYLVLYGTGIRGRSSLGGVTVAVGGMNLPAIFAGAQGLPGLDQVNVLLPNSLAGKGIVAVVLTVDGQTANQLTITIK